jgi:hypothetical protein
MSQSLHSKIEEVFNRLSTEPPPAQCAKCGSIMTHLDTTFFTTGPMGRIWAVPLPVCPKCDLKEDTALFVS